MTDAGDLYLIAKVKPHPVFSRNGADLTREVPITLGEALLGGEVEVETLGGRVLLKVPPGTQQGQTFRLAGKGMPRLKGGGVGRPLRQGQGRPARQAGGPAAQGRGGVPAPDRPAEPAKDLREARMNLDHFTQKAQESIVAAQRLAEELQSPVLDSEHLLAALVEADDGIAGGDAAASRRRRAGLPRRAGRGPQQAGEDPGRFPLRGPPVQARRRASRGRGSPPPRRLRLHRASAAGHRRGRRRGPAAAGPQRGQQGGDPAGPGERPGRPARDQPEPRGHVPGPGEVRPRPHGRGARRQAGSGHRPRRGDPPRHPGPDRAAPRTTRS